MPSGTSEYSAGYGAEYHVSIWYLPNAIALIFSSLGRGALTASDEPATEADSTGTGVPPSAGRFDTCRCEARPDALAAVDWRPSGS